MSSWMKMNFQDAMSPIMHHLIIFHEYILFFIIMILMMILYISIFITKMKFYSNKIINLNLLKLLEPYYL